MPFFGNLTMPLFWAWGNTTNATYQVSWKLVCRFRRRRLFKGFYHVWTWGPSWSCRQIFISLYLKAFIQSLVQIDTVVSEKIQFEFLNVHNLGPRSRNDLDLQYSHIFIINSIRCLLLPTFRSVAAIVSEKSNVFTFSYRKA